MESTGWQRLNVNEGLFVKNTTKRGSIAAHSADCFCFGFSITSLFYLSLPAKIERAEASWTASATVIAGSAAVVVIPGEVAEVTGSEVMVMAGIGGIEN